MASAQGEPDREDRQPGHERVVAHGREVEAVGRHAADGRGHHERVARGLREEVAHAPEDEEERPDAEKNRRQPEGVERPGPQLKHPGGDAHAVIRDAGFALDGSHRLEIDAEMLGEASLRIECRLATEETLPLATGEVRVFEGVIDLDQRPEETGVADVGEGRMVGLEDGVDARVGKGARVEQKVGVLEMVALIGSLRPGEGRRGPEGATPCPQGDGEEDGPTRRAERQARRKRRDLSLGFRRGAGLAHAFESIKRSVAGSTRGNSLIATNSGAVDPSRSSRSFALVRPRSACGRCSETS